MLRELDGSGEHFVRGTVLLSAFVGLEELHEAVAEILDLSQMQMFMPILSIRSNCTSREKKYFYTNVR